jgi:hypothetical protein
LQLQWGRMPWLLAVECCWLLLLLLLLLLGFI